VNDIEKILSLEIKRGAKRKNYSRISMNSDLPNFKIQQYAGGVARI